MKPREELARDAGIEQIVGDLRRARAELAGFPAGPARDRLDLLLTRVELGLAELKQQPTAGPAAFADVAMAQHEFEALHQSVQKKWPDRERLATIRTFGGSGRFTSAQVAALLKTFDFDNDRIEAAVLLYPHIVDPVQFFQALDAFAFSNSAQKVRERLNLT